MIRTATDCTRPALRDGLTFFQSTGESSKPTNLSKTRRACCALTKSISNLRGLSMALRIAVLVISEKTIRLVFSIGISSASSKCQDIASPSRSSSVANQTTSAFCASFFKSLTTSCLSAVIS